MADTRLVIQSIFFTSAYPDQVPLLFFDGNFIKSLVQGVNFLRGGCKYVQVVLVDISNLAELKSMADEFLSSVELPNEELKIGVLVRQNSTANKRTSVFILTRVFKTEQKV